MYYCKTLDANGTCTEWSAVVNPFLPALTAQEGRELGISILYVLAIAFAMRLLRDLILNRS